MKKYSLLLNNQIKRNPKRYVYTMVGIVLSVILLTISVYFYYHISENLRIRAITYEGDYDVIFSGISLDEGKKIKDNALIKKGGLVYLHSIEIKDSDETQVYSMEKNVLDDFLYERVKIIQGRFPEGKREIVINSNNRINIGENINFQGEEYKVVGEFISKGNNNLSTGNKANEIYGIKLLDKGIDYDNRLSLVTKLKDSESVDESISKILSDSKGKNQIYVEVNTNLTKNYINTVRSNDGKLIEEKIFITSVILIILLLNILLTYGAINISLREKIKTFTTLRFIGATRKKIQYLILKESLIIGGISILVGILIGHIITYFILIYSNDVFFDGESINQSFKIYPQVIFISIILSILSISISSLLPIIKGGKINPVQMEKVIKIKKRVKNRRGTFIRKRFGYSAELAYKSLKGDNRNFITNMAILVILFVGFVSFTTYYTSAESLFIEKDGVDFKFSYSNISGEKEVGYNEIDRYLSEGDKIVNYLGSEYGIENISLRPTFMTSMIIKGVELSENFKNGSTAFIDGDSYSYIPYGELYIISDKEYVKYFGEGALDDIIVAGVKKSIITNKIKSPISLVHRDNLSLKFSENIENVLEVSNNEFVKLDNIGILSDYEVMNAVTNNQNPFTFILSRGFYEKNKVKLFKGIEDPRGIYEVRFKFDNGLTEKDINEIKDYCNTNGYWYYDVVEESKIQGTKLKIIALLTYLFLGLITIIAVINIINNKQMEFNVRKKEFGTMIATGISKKKLRNIIIYEWLFQWWSIAIIGGCISLIIQISMFLGFRYVGVPIILNKPVAILIIALVVLGVITLITNIGIIRGIGKCGKNIQDMLRSEE